MARVFVYWNLHKNVYSVKALEGPHKGKVIAHATAVGLAQVSTKVSEKVRQRVIETKKKEVHAGLVGNLGHLDKNAKLLQDGYEPYRTFGSTYSTAGYQYEIGYNPYKHGFFYVKDEVGLAFDSASTAMMLGNRKILVRGAKVTPFAEKMQQNLF